MVKDLLDGLDLESIVRSSVNESRRSLIKEAYVAEPKKFSQTSEFVSQKTKDAHVKLYEAYVDNVNRISNELDSVEKDLESVNSAHSDFRSLKLDETFNLNTKWLHELYFANCYDPHSEIYMDSLSYIKLQRDFGDFESWQRDMMACATSCGNGWAVTAFSLHLQRYVNTIVSNNSQDVMIGLFPVLCIDMHEHAYFRDYGVDKRSYLTAMMREINWRVVEERVVKAEAIAKVLK